MIIFAESFMLMPMMGGKRVVRFFKSNWNNVL
jgi:hypothetical protein